MDRIIHANATLSLRPLAVDDAAGLLDYYGRNATHLQPWEPTRDAAFYTLDRQRAEIAKSVSDRRNGTTARYLAFEAQTETIAGTIALSNIRRGVNEAAIVGYSVDARRAGRGLATEMLRAVVAYAFDAMYLHRIEASYQPANRASGRVLEKAGFSVEGFARDYLLLDGAWRDGVLVSRRNDAWRPR